MRQFQASHFGPFPGTFRVSAHSGLHWDRADEGGGAGVREQSRHTCGWLSGKHSWDSIQLQQAGRLRAFDWSSGPLHRLWWSYTSQPAWEGQETPECCLDVLNRTGYQVHVTCGRHILHVHYRWMHWQGWHMDALNMLKPLLDCRDFLELGNHFKNLRTSHSFPPV